MEVYLVRHDFVAFVLVHRAVDGALQHEIGAQFPSPFLHGLGGGVVLLVGFLLAQLVPFGSGHDEARAAILHDGLLDVLDEGFRADVLVAFVVHQSDDDHGAFVVHPGVFAGPCRGEHVGDHRFRHEPGIGVVPASAQVDDFGRVYPRDGSAPASVQQGDGENEQGSQDDSFHVVLFFSV